MSLSVSAHSLKCNLSFEEDEWEEAASDLRPASMSRYMVRTTLESELERRGITCEHAIDGNGCRCLHVTSVETDDAEGLAKDLDHVAQYAYPFDIRKAAVVYMIDDDDRLFCWCFKNMRCVTADVALCPKWRKGA